MGWVSVAAAALIAIAVIYLWRRNQQQRPASERRDDLVPKRCPECQGTDVERTDEDPQYRAWIGPDSIKLHAHCSTCGHGFTF